MSFVWIGDGELRHVLKAENITVTGWEERKEALAYAMQGDVFLLTSLWEGLPISLLEAMYMKKLCIVSDVIGNRDVIRSGDNGFVCRNVAEFVSAVRAAQEGKTETFVKNAYMDIVEHYSTENTAKKYRIIYKVY